MEQASGIEWDHVGQERFDRIVDLLLHRRYSSDPDLEGVPFDGLGGDQGRDFQVKRGDLVETIYQYKYFPEGFSGGFSPRRKQIKKSFDRAMQHRPRRWVLITPGNVKTPEYDYVKSLGQGRDVIIEVEGRAALDSAIAAHPDIRDYFTRQALIETLRLLDKERFSLEDPADAAATLGELRRQLDARNPNWGWRTSMTAEGTTHTLYPKHPQAQAIEPITLSANVPADSPIAHQWRELIEYGSLEETLVITQGGPESFRFDGPAALLPPPGPGHLEITSIPYLADEPIELRVLDREGATTTAIRGTITNANIGSLGQTLVAAFPGGLTIRFLMPQDEDGDGFARLTCESDGKDAIAVYRERRALDEAIAGSGAVQLWRREQLFWSLLVADHPPLPVDNDPTLVEDLAVIAKFMEVPLIVPSRVTVRERQTIRTLRLLLEGHCVLIPAATHHNPAYQPEARETIRAYLGRNSIWRVHQHWIFPIQGHDLRLERLCLFHPSTHIANEPEVRALLDSDTEEDIRLEIRSTDGTPFRAVLPHLVPDPSSPLIPVPLDIVDLPEHPALQQIRAILPTHDGDEPAK